MLLMVDRYQMGKWNKGGFDGFVDMGYKWVELLLGWDLWVVEMAMEHTAAFAGRIVVGTMLFSRMVGCRIAIAQADCFVEMLRHYW